MEPDKLAEKCVDELIALSRGIIDDTTIRGLLRCAYFQGRIDGKTSALEMAMEAMK